ncbi:decaprenyl-diphosphate synthase subunit 1 isoform X2 [Carcharodon carcharias]|uniref:decaprenyl-diphosphate synthase subunit 1 isoform X2 n=1 Tax=Carcharodon carcharias TaxID=13397 RepID=UPI001B7E3B6B|nr:decaprenyl-diphosphate synthase subunit 1 isoform X2 [Carcharodon carcharias]
MALLLSRCCAWNKRTSGFAGGALNVCSLFNGCRDREAPPAGYPLAREVGAGAGRRHALVKELYLHRRIYLNTTAYKKPVSLWRTPSRLMYTTRTKCCCNQVHSDKQYKNPYTLAQEDLKNLYDEIRRLLAVSSDLKEICDYYFDGKGKAFRPMIVVLMAKACNLHHSKNRNLLKSQHSIGMIVEMIHTASLVHDDVIDGSDTRRGKITVNKIWGERKAILAGDFVLSAASVALARLGNNSVVSMFTQAIEDLVRGEFMQLGSKENENERFMHYLEKTFKKTASLIANSCKAVSILGNCDPDVQEIAYQYGRNIGIAFQLVDDVLDFTSCANQLGKPTATDLKLGLATGPVLFACQQN